MNTRDMTDFAIDGELDCYDALKKAGGVEKGMRYVDLNRLPQERPVDIE